MHLRTTIGLLADDIGRLRRRFASNDAWTGAYIADRLARHTEALHLAVTPTAAQLAVWHAPGDDDAIHEAIRLVDAHWHALQTRLGKPAT